MRLSEVVHILDGKLVSDGDFSTLNYCTAESNVAFLTFLEDRRFIDQINNNECISCILCNEELKNQILRKHHYGLFITKEPKAAFHTIHNSLMNNIDYCLPSYKTSIGENCKLSPLSYIAPNNVLIGNNVTIGEFVVINEHISIGDNCSIHSGTTIGGKSFTFTRSGTDEVLGMCDMGQVILEDNVEIYSNCHIARGTLPTDCTIIGSNSKLDVMYF